MALLGSARLLAAQVPAEPILQGSVLIDQSPLARATVVLHHVSSEFQGEVDSVTTAADGAFSFRLPNVPDPARGDIFFASVRHSGILYFGPAISTPIELDSTYTIQAYDTVVVAASGVPLPIQARNTFLEAAGDSWNVTDLIQVRNERNRTLVARPGGVVWRYPMPTGARNPTVGQGSVPADGVSFDGGDVVLRAPLPPGERLVVIRYITDSPFLEMPSPGVTEVLEVLIQEPAPPIESSILIAQENVELEPGSTYRRLSAEELTDEVVRLREGVPDSRFPIEWISVILALVLTGFGLMAVSRAAPGRPPPSGQSTDSRESLILEIARMDAAFSALDHPGQDESEAYGRRRRELFRRLRSLG